MFPKNILGTDSISNITRTVNERFLALVRQPRRCSGRLLPSSFKYDISRVYDHPRYRRMPTQELVYDFTLVSVKLLIKYD